MAVASALASMLVLQGGAAWAGSLSYPDFSSTAGLKLNGDARTKGGALRLTRSRTDEIGGFFTRRKKIDPRKAIHTRFRIHIHEGSGQPADGMAFVIHNDPAGNAALGEGGSAMGYGNKDGADPISSSLAVEFDIYDVGAAPDLRIIAEGDQEGPPLGKVDANLYGRKLWVWVDYSPSKARMKVFLARRRSKPATPKLRADFDLNEILSGQRAFVGFTAATGGEFAKHDVLSWTLRNP